MRVLHEAMESVVRSLQKSELKGFVVNIRELVERQLVPPLVSVCLNILEARNRSTVRHGVAVEKHCVICLATGEHIIIVIVAGERSVRDTKMVRCRSLKIRRNNAMSIEDGIEVE